MHESRAGRTRPTFLQRTGAAKRSRAGGRDRTRVEPLALPVARDPRGVPAELLVVWAFFLVVAAEIFATYSRLAPEELYHVSGSGVTAGAGRALVFLNYPVALVALPAILLLLDRLAVKGAGLLAAIGLALSATVFWPGVVDQADLDAKPVNALAALGVLVAVVMTIAVARRGGLEPLRRPLGTTEDRLRVALAAVALVLATPWLLADLGVSLDGVPVLGSVWQTGELRSQPGVAGLHPAVHHGHHHGMDGVLLTLTALLLSRTIPAIRRPRLRPSTAALLSLMLAYGLVALANDFWLEQVVKRGWTDWEIPDVTRPTISIGWAVIVIGACAVYRFWFGKLAGRGPAVLAHGGDALRSSGPRASPGSG